MAMLNDAQKITARVYDGGQFEEFAATDGNCGDVLFHFIMTEISDREGCTEIDEARGRIERAIEQMQIVLAALENA